MNQSIQASAPPLLTDAAKDAFDRLLFLGWRTGLTAIVAGLATSFFLFGYTVIYWRNADMDFMVIYNALVLNDGKPQLFFDHTAYITILSVKFWFQLLHALGLLDAYSLSAIPSAANSGAFDAAMTSAVRAGRLLAWLVATGCVLIFAALVRPVVRDWRVAMLATLAFAFSGGIAVHSRILRSELVAACPVIFALLILIVAGRSARRARPLAMALAAALCVLGLENKVQVILLIGTLPLVILPFGAATSASVAFWRNPRSGWLAVIIAALAAMAAAWAAWPLAAVGFDRTLLDAAHFHPLLLGRFGIYQAALLMLTGGCMIAYAVIWRVSATETLASMFAMAALCRCRHQRCRQWIEPMGGPAAAARWVGIGRGALQFRAALLGASRRLSHLADRPRYCRGVAARRKACHRPGHRAAAGRRRDRHAGGAARAEDGIFHIHRPPDYPRGRNPARSFERFALSQMGLPCRGRSVRTAYRCRPGGTGEIRVQAHRSGIDLRMEPVLPSAAAAALVYPSSGPAITAD